MQETRLRTHDAKLTGSRVKPSDIILLTRESIKLISKTKWIWWGVVLIAKTNNLNPFPRNNTVEEEYQLSDNK